MEVGGLRGRESWQAAVSINKLSSNAHFALSDLKLIFFLED
jgi:hypothetical protein